MRPDPSPNWEVSFYRSLADADGVLFLGGGYSTEISGQVAIAMRLPVLAIRAFGGASEKVWNSLSPSDFPTDHERDAMGEDWPEGEYDAHSLRLVDILIGQIDRRRAENRNVRKDIAESAVNEARKERLLEQESTAARWSPMAAILLGLALGCFPFVFEPRHIEFWFLALLPFLAGGAGALTRSVTRLGEPPEAHSVSGVDVALGLVAGGIAGLLFIGIQLFNYPNALATATDIESFAAHTRKLVVLNTSIGFIAGLTWERVFGKLGAVDVVNTEVLTNALVKGAEEGESKIKDSTS